MVRRRCDRVLSIGLSQLSEVLTRACELSAEWLESPKKSQSWLDHGFFVLCCSGAFLLMNFVVAIAMVSYARHHRKSWGQWIAVDSRQRCAFSVRPRLSCPPWFAVNCFVERNVLLHEICLG
jgi:hypothetical protein